ncbi:MAG: hypothetical protein WC882_00595 [Candidatus Gracilibacteria bacterium]
MENLTEDVLDPRIQYVIEHDLSDGQHHVMRAILRVLGSSPGTIFSIEEISRISGLTLPASHMTHIASDLIKLSYHFKDYYGFYIQLGTYRASSGCSANTYCLNLTPDWVLKPRERRLHQVRPGDPLVPLTAKMRGSMQRALDTELNLRGLPRVRTVEAPFLGMDQLLQNGTWVLRPETREFEIGERLLDASKQGCALKLDSLFSELDIPQEKMGDIMERLEKLTLQKALELGFLTQRVAQLRAYFAMVFLDPLERGRALDKKYLGDSFRPDFLSPLIPFDARKFKGRFYSRKGGIKEGVPDRLREIFFLCISAMDRKKPLTLKEAGKVLGVSGKCVENWVRRSEESNCREIIGGYLRMRADDRIEPVLLDFKWMRRDMEEDERLKRKMNSPISEEWTDEPEIDEVF